MFYKYSNNCQIFQSEIIYNFAMGIEIYGESKFIKNIIIKDCLISSNQGFWDGVIGINIIYTRGISITNCSIYHHPYCGIQIAISNNVNISNCEILNNRDGIGVLEVTSNINITNNTLVGNLEYAIYNWGISNLNAENNYFGTNDKIQIKALTCGNIDYIPWLEYRESNVFHLNITEEWNNRVIYLNKGLIINGKIIINNCSIIMNDVLG